ncbi:MAG: AAA family ATPase [Paracoccaceae bacterium]|nr:AAA family ATPase [Paracoccaceae bacterium]
MNVDAWLRGLGLGEYSEAFCQNGVDASLLPELNNEDLKDIGVGRLADRKRLLAAIAELGAEKLEMPATPEAPAEGERRQVTVLFADIADFTGISERLGAEATHEILNRYFEAADRIVEEFGGAVDKHMGDNVMAVFGAPTAHDNDPERAVCAALAIHEAARGIGLPGGGALRLHIGIASGQVVASGTGSDTHREYTVTGDSVNLAARLQGLAGLGQTLVSEAVQRQTSGNFAIAGLGPRKLKGIDRSVTVWRIDGTLDDAGGGRSTPFVGRRAELGQCRAILDEVAATGEGQTILLRGPAGIGKTRLAEEVARFARKAGFAVHRSLVLDFGSRRGQGAIPALVRSLIGLSSSSAEEDRARAADAAFAVGAFAETDWVFVNDLLDFPQPLELRRLYDAMDDAARRAGRGRLVAGLVAWASHAAPQLILVEDLHWADDQTLDRLAAVMATASENPVALMATTRPEGDPLEGAWRAASLDQPVSIINLGPLRASEARAMAAGFTRANEDWLTECLQRAAGNPLFLEQLLQNVAESASTLVPGSIQSLVLARMDRLDPLDKRALQVASVFGQRFSSAALQRLLETQEFDCAELLRHQLIRPEGEDYLFAHALIRDGVYESILTAARQRLHLRAAEWFEGGDPGLYAEHLDLACDPRAPGAYLEAAHAELANYRYAQAIALLIKGKALAEDPADRVVLALALGEAKHDIGALAEASAEFNDALRAAPDETSRCRALLGLAGVKRITEDVVGALADLDTAQEMADRLGLTAEAARAHFLRGNLLFPRGDTEGCLREHGLALDLARQAGSAELEAAALGGLADAEYLCGRFRTACQLFTECVDVSRAHGLGRIEVANLPMVAVTAEWSGDSDRAMAVAVESIEAARRVHDARAELIGHDMVFFGYRSRGDLRRARAHIEKALEIARRLGARRFEAEVLAFSGHIDHLEGNLGEGLRKARAGLAITREIDTGMAFMGPTLLGLLMLTTDDPAERERARAEAEELLAAGSVSHNQVYFRTFAIDACLAAREFDEAERHANALADFCAEERLFLIEFLAGRGQALARAGRGEASPELATELDRLIAAGTRMHQEVWLGALRQAREALAA